VVRVSSVVLRRRSTPRRRSGATSCAHARAIASLEVLLPAVSEAVVAAMNAMLAGADGRRRCERLGRAQVAAAVEACLFEQCGGVADNQYVGKARSLLFNLKTTDNAPLRVSLVRGQITPLQLCNMSAKVTQIDSWICS
jgi:hypothetical protein